MPTSQARRAKRQQSRGQLPPEAQALAETIQNLETRISRIEQVLMGLFSNRPQQSSSSTEKPQSNNEEDAKSDVTELIVCDDSDTCKEITDQVETEPSETKTRCKLPPP